MARLHIPTSHHQLTRLKQRPGESRLERCCIVSTIHLQCTWCQGNIWSIPIGASRLEPCYIPAVMTQTYHTVLTLQQYRICRRNMVSGDEDEMAAVYGPLTSFLPYNDLSSTDISDTTTECHLPASNRNIRWCSGNVESKSIFRERQESEFR